MKLIVDKIFNKFQCNEWHRERKTMRVTDNCCTVYRKNQIFSKNQTPPVNLVRITTVRAYKERTSLVLDGL